MPLELKVDADAPIPCDEKRTVLFGRSSQCDVLLSDEGASDKHCLLVFGATHWRVYDLQSESGLFLNGKRVERARLQNGDVLRMGGHSIEVRITPISSEAGAKKKRPKRAAVSSASSDAAAGKKKSHRSRIGGFQLDELIRRGSTGDFYRATWRRRTRPPKRVLIKVLRKPTGGNEETLYRFCRGAAAGGVIRHPNVARLYRGGRKGKSWFLAMEWMPGGSLHDVLARGEGAGLDPDFVRKVGIDIAKALEATAERHVVHGNIRPKSIFFAANGTAKLGDFTWARTLDEDPKDDPRARLTTGRLAYMSPEQLSGDRPDARSDLYSLGATLYEALTGQPPFRAHNEAETIHWIRQKPARPPSDTHPSIPARLELVVLAALVKRPETRFATAAEFRAALERS